jgi:hypothetical protein
VKSSRGETDSGSKSGVIPIILVIALGLSGASAVLVWGLIGVFSGEPPVGDGQDSSSYGFDLSNLDIDPEALAASGNPRDFLFPLVDPMVVSGPDVAGLNASNKRKWQKEVVSGDRVLGVEIGDSSRAYPMFILDAHEVVLDRIGETPIVIARSPLVDEVMVFERRLDGVPLELGVSGLLDDLSLVMHDRDPVAASLLSGHDGRFIAGPRVGLGLDPVPGVVVTTWQDWLARHPETDVVLRDGSSLQRYRRVSYDRYLDGSLWIIPPRDTIESSVGARDRVLAVRPSGGGTPWSIFPLAELAARMSPEGISVAVGDLQLVVAEGTGDPTATIDLIQADGLELRFGFWHAASIRDPEAADAALERGRLALRDAVKNDVPPSK